MSTPKKRLLTGLQPSGALHIGNYFGALKPFADIYEDYESFLMVADYHALTSLRDAEALRKNTLDVVRDYLAVGVDPEKAVIFKQSDNQDHVELGWVMNCLVTVPFLMQAHSYKDKVAKGIEPNAGLFTYPMLMAADILLYNTDVVPVGEDQRQHLEYAREAVGKFNRSYATVVEYDGFVSDETASIKDKFKILKEPKELILSGVGVVPGTDGLKMSKSYGNTIPLFGTRAELEKAVMSIVTDSSGEKPANVYAIHILIKSAEELDPIYEEHKGRYGDLKKILLNDLDEFIAPMREKRAQITDDEVKAVLEDGVKKAKIVSHEILESVRKAVGVR